VSGEEIRAYLRKIGTPERDNNELPTSKKRFPDGTDYKIELILNTVDEYEKAFDLCDKHNVACNRILDLNGTMFDSDDVIIRKCEICRDHKTELVMAPAWGEHDADISQQLALHAMQSGKLRGADNVVNSLMDMVRAIELGCRGFIFYDEGALNIACGMRRDGLISQDVALKVSSLLSIANPAAMEFWVSNLDLKPWDTINPVRDLTLPMLASMRAVADQAFDIHIFWKDSTARTLEVPEIVRICAPVVFKNARSGTHLWTNISFEERFLQSVRIIDTIERQYPAARQSPITGQGPGIPVKPAGNGGKKLAQRARQIQIGRSR
jgi:hypothetical protein